MGGDRGGCGDLVGEGGGVENCPELRLPPLPPLPLFPSGVLERRRKGFFVAPPVAVVVFLAARLRVITEKEEFVAAETNRVPTGQHGTCFLNKVGKY